MSADSLDNLPYRPADEMADERARRHYWACAIGLQAVDNLQVSDYLREAAEAYVCGARELRGRRFHVIAGNNDSRCRTLQTSEGR